MMDIMSSIFQEGESLSQEILDAILVNFVEPAKVCVLTCELHLSMSQYYIPPCQTNSRAAYEFAADFVRKSSQYLEPYIQLVSMLQ